MAQLIHELAVAGARDSSGAPLSTGRAWFFQPGTVSSQAIVYSDPDGLAALPQPVALDAGGRATVYTKTACRVQLEDVNGVLVAVFDRGNTVQAGAVEVESAGFTGTILSGSSEGSQGAGGRTDQGTVLNRIYSSLGGVDAQYQILSTSGARVGGPRPLTTALSEIVINVKSFLCGDGLPVAGDGVHVDTSGIQAAVNYVSSIGGGILYFPPGTYLIDQVITLTSGSGVSIQGAGRRSSRIKTANGISGIFSLTSCSGFFINGIGFTSAISTGVALTLTTCSNVIIDGIGVDENLPAGGTFRMGILLTGGGNTNIRIGSSVIYTSTGDAAARAIKVDNSAAQGSNIAIANVTMASFSGKDIEILRTTRLTISQCDTSSVVYSDSLSDSNAIVNCPRGPLIDISAYGSSNGPIIDQHGNNVDGYTTNVASGGTVVPDLSKLNTQLGTVRIVGSSTGIAFTVGAPAPKPASTANRGFSFCMMLQNSAGGAVTGWTMNAVYHFQTAPSLTDGQMTTYLWKWDQDNQVYREAGRSVTTI